MHNTGGWWHVLPPMCLLSLLGLLSLRLHICLLLLPDKIVALHLLLGHDSVLSHTVLLVFRLGHFERCEDLPDAVSGVTLMYLDDTGLRFWIISTATGSR